MVEDGLLFAVLFRGHLGHGAEVEVTELVDQVDLK